ncbi:MAG TPA: thermonuclease family protein [Candidatus Gastranaerophilales bacterium]|nr:thermonuclease family protein [Candidatus Gastranaerophilales bacterium]
MKGVFMFRFLISLIFSVIISFSGSFCLADNLAVVKRVVDGDTIKVEYQDKLESVRLIGIDTPESRINKRTHLQTREYNQDAVTIVELGKKAKNYTNSLVKAGDKVKLEFDVQQRDKYRRLLAYVWLKNGKMLNEEIIKNGYAQALTIPPSVKYEKRFLKAYKYARNNNLGLWQDQI